jgi:hypothetical protein
MCSLCGMLGAPDHWTESAGSPSVFAGREAVHTRQRERQARTRLINTVLAHYGLNLRDWSGSAYLLSNRTGRTVIVNDLAQLWAAAERMIGRECDPLDDGLVRALEAAGT